MIIVESTDTDLRVTIPKDAMPSERFNAFVDWLRMEEIVHHSRISEAEADRIAETMKADWWRENKARFVGQSDE